jgi:uncharacterized protein YkwD
MNRTLLLGSMMGGVIIVFITTIFSFTPNSADPSSIPLLKEYTYKLVNKERQKFNVQPIKEGEAIAAEKQAKYILTQPTITHLDSSGNSPRQRYLQTRETRFIGENIFIYRCEDLSSCETAISFAIEEIIKKDKEAKSTILNPNIIHLSIGIAVGKGKIAAVLDFERR